MGISLRYVSSHLSFDVKSDSQKCELLITLQNCIFDKFAFITICEFYPLIKDINQDEK